MVYERQIALALRMISEKGELCIWHSVGEPTGGAPGKPGSRPTTDYPNTPIVFFPMTSRKSVSSIEGTEVKTGYVMGYMPQVPFTPKGGDILTRADGREYQLELNNSIEELDPNGEKVLYTLYLVRA